VTQLVPIPEAVLRLPERAASVATHDLVFRAHDLPPLGFRSYYVSRVSPNFEDVQPSDDTTIGDTVSKTHLHLVEQCIDLSLIVVLPELFNVK
jgi:lysosomal alpha-mannosidase